MRNEQKKNSQKRTGEGDRSYSERVRAKWFCCAYKLAFLQLFSSHRSPPCSFVPLYIYIYIYFFFYVSHYTQLLVHLITVHLASHLSLSSIVFIISTLIISMFYCLNYTSLLLHLFITHLLIDFIITMQLTCVIGNHFNLYKYH